MDFDSTLEFPGEGPLSRWLFLGMVMTLKPGSPIEDSAMLRNGDAARAQLRAGLTLEEGKRVTQTTSVTRELLFDNFKAWAGEVI